MVIVLSRKHAVVFGALMACQLLSLWVLRERFQAFAGLGVAGWCMVLMGEVGSAFLSTIIIVELANTVFAKPRSSN